MGPHDERILPGLEELERTHGVRILHACEGGSRAWGFASQDSDFDVRFLYLHPREWYVRIFPAPTVGRHSVLEHMSADRQLDLVGWDLRKALGLLFKSNPPLLEHLHSPIVYRSSPELEELRALARRYYSPARCLAHYLHMTQGNFRDCLQGDRVRTKKYLYVLRPVLACRWIEQGRGSSPVEFARLVERALPEDPALHAASEILLERKRSGLEMDDGPRIPEISSFLEQELERLAEVRAGLEVEAVPTAPLDEYFRRVAGF